MSLPYPVIEVAVVLITDPRGERLLADYNPDWGGFTLPMTKRRNPGHADEPWAQEAESPLAAATRAAVEVLGRPLPPDRLPVPLPFELPPWEVSLRDGGWKRYTRWPFALVADGTPHPLPGHVALWLTPAEFEKYEPISPTVSQILGAIPFVDVKKALRL
ncbi:hypothetical protein [Fimbriiglobus ruber]|uniref:Nudix hydrolase domain-containing protein n=1 Tax=Fimbriiglobus ruber TaxID=1908690 RepID=A0A225DQT1_9BACT|nr:hypothetical protein [Fimbriiglobus ruber]OWK43752.1 hypothetical protein FRUB_03351 [Fimbriiglobus ruber]